MRYYNYEIIVVSHQKYEIKSYNYEILGHTYYIKNTNYETLNHNDEVSQNWHKKYKLWQKANIVKYKKIIMRHQVS